MSENSLNKLQFPQVVVVEASAGSGKTFCLAKRYLQLLINSQVSSKSSILRNILAITFTNKATIEMKERILEFLKRIALDNFGDVQEEKDFFQALNIDKNTIKNKANIIMDEIIRHYNFFQVQTIDSFINTLLLGSALNIDRSANFQIKKDYKRQLNFCLDLVIEGAQKDKNTLKLLEEFLQHYLFVESRTGWFPKEDILNFMHSLFSLSNKYGRTFLPYQGQSKDLIKQKKNIYQKILKMSEKFPQKLNNNAKKSIFAFIDKSEPIFDLSDLPSALKHLNPPMNKGGASSQDFNKEWASIHRDLKELIEFDALLAYKPYLLLFEKLVDNFQLISKKEDILFLEELNKRARLLFDDQGITVAEVYYRLATRFKHFLIDEFQDTSILQWHNLEPMTQEALSSGGSLFYVGDKKQAIYRFRGGEAGLFDEVSEKFKNFNVWPSYLTKNWRSQKEIVDFNNLIFSNENIDTFIESSGIFKEIGHNQGYKNQVLDVFKDSKQDYCQGKDKGYVYIEKIEEKNQTQRDEIIKPKLLNTLSELNQRFQYKDIAILTRDNREVELITSWCLEEGISVESEKTLNVCQNNLIKEIINFLKFLNSPISDLDFAAFILGDIFTTATSIDKSQIREFVFNLHKNHQMNQDFYLYRLFRKNYPDVWDKYIDDLFKKIGFLSVYELVSAVYQRFEVQKNFASSQAFFMKLLELVKKNEEESVSVSDFLRYLEDPPAEELYVNTTESNSVKILTIHKSKGLEFPVVVIPFLRIDINPQSGMRSSNTYVVATSDQDLRLVRLTKTHRGYSETLNKIYQEQYTKATIDELNNIYVALTRACFELYAFVPQKSSSSKNKVLSLMPQGLIQRGEKEKYELSPKDGQEIFNIKFSSYSGLGTIINLEKTSKEELTNREKIKIGEVMHLILSKIGNCKGRKIDQMLKEAISSARKNLPFLDNIPLLEDRLKGLLNNEDLKDIFYIEGGEVFCERNIVNRFGDLKRLDRLIVKADEVRVIDYKSSMINFKEQAKQIIQYIDILKDIYPKQQVRGFLLYLDTLELKEIRK